jgi:hypothetical protein
MSLVRLRSSILATCLILSFRSAPATSYWSMQLLLIFIILGQHPLPVVRLYFRLAPATVVFFCCCWSNPTGRLVLLIAGYCRICWSHFFGNQLCVSQIETSWCSIVLIFSDCFVYLAFCFVVPILRWQMYLACSSRQYSSQRCSFANRWNFKISMLDCGAP